MKRISLLRNQKGIVLVGVVGLMVFLGLFGAVGTSVVSSSHSAHEFIIKSSQALALAHAGSEWYLEQLQSDTNWSNETTQTKALGQGTFTITVLSASATEVRFRSTGMVPSPWSGVLVQRYMTMNAQKIPSAFRFALFQGMDPGANFEIQSQSNTQDSYIAGDVWSRGSVEVDDDNVVTGKVYVPNMETVTGTGSYTARQIQPPYLAMPVINTASYTTLLSGYDTQLAGNSSHTDRQVTNGIFNINTDSACSAGVCRFRNFTTRGNVTITGNGTIMANRAINLHSDNNLNGDSLNVTPSPGGSIIFLANRDIIIGSNNSNPAISAASGSTFYSRSNGGSYEVHVRGNQTVIRHAQLFSQRRILVERAAKILDNSLIYVNDAGTTTNNYLQVYGVGGQTTVEGTLISLSRNTSGAIRIENASLDEADCMVRGLVYAAPQGSFGYCQIRNSTVQGSVVCNRYTNNDVRNIQITYDAGAFPSPLPAGFEGAVTVAENSWDGL